jgi:hypothetical protein
VSVTAARGENWRAQAEGQAIPAGTLVTVPLPLTVTDTTPSDRSDDAAAVGARQIAAAMTISRPMHFSVVG